VEEALRCQGVIAVVGATGHAVDLAASRRLQLAAEAGGTLGLILDATGAAAGRMAANALTTRWRVAARPAAETAEGIGIGQARWRLELWRCRGGRNGGMWNVEWRAETGDFIGVRPATNRPSLPWSLPVMAGTPSAVAPFPLARAG